MSGIEVAQPSENSLLQKGRSSRYPVNLRFTIPFWPHALFVTVIIGPEKRSDFRLKKERNDHPLLTWGNFAACFTAGTVFQIALLFVLLVVVAL